MLFRYPCATFTLSSGYLQSIFFTCPCAHYRCSAAITSAKPTILNSLYTPFSFYGLPMRHAFSQPLKEISLELTLIVVIKFSLSGDFAFILLVLSLCFFLLLRRRDTKPLAKEYFCNVNKKLTRDSSHVSKK